ncbi:MAG: glucose-6-phosphate isomerase, partial [Clostridium sp.]|nr:glucose-6-phosphate isomerase [Clostridium sp.]
MQMNVRFDESKISGFVSNDELEMMKKPCELARETLIQKTGAGNQYLGWVDLPQNYDKEEFERIKKTAATIQAESEIFVVAGIGGSYLGARAAIEFLGHSFRNQLPAKVRNAPEIYFCGNSISSSYLQDLLDVIGDRDFCVNMISKSGKTTEPSIAFRILKEKLERKYGSEGAAKRIYVTTDKSRGTLKKLADAKGYATFVVPDGVGGRFSVLTAVGLLPIAVSGVDIDALMDGATAMRERCISESYEKNDALRYAAIRNILLRKGKQIEVMANYEPSVHYISEWWKQLYGESEGKDHKGIFPASVDLTTDLHSMGQYIQDGSRNLFETVIDLESSRATFTMQEEEVDLDG